MGVPPRVLNAGFTRLGPGGFRWALSSGRRSRWFADRRYVARMVCVSAAAAWDPAQLGVRSDLDGALRHDRHCRLAGLAPHDIHTTAPTMGLATGRQCLLDPRILCLAQSAASACRLSRAAGPDRADYAD